MTLSENWTLEKTSSSVFGQFFLVSQLRASVFQKQIQLLAGIIDAIPPYFLGEKIGFFLQLIDGIPHGNSSSHRIEHFYIVLLIPKS